MNVAIKTKIPLFPLNTVLFPVGVLPLRIFEPRYLDMISQCLKSDSGIGVILILEGNEVGSAAKIHNMGTLCEISYWHKRRDGLLGVTLTGKQRFSVLSSEIQANQLIMAEVELLPNIENLELFEDVLLSRLLKQILSQFEPPFSTMLTHYDDQEWVSARLTELLPLSLKDKQKMLSMNNIHERIELLKNFINNVETK